jgi:hypothetical protein
LDLAPSADDGLKPRPNKRNFNADARTLGEPVREAFNGVLERRENQMSSLNGKRIA